jgi:hypothetical protein
MHKAGMLFFVCAGLLGLALLLPRPAAAWPDDPGANVALCDTTGNQFNATSIPDGGAPGEAGAIVTWQDYRSGNYDIYAQRISADGTPLWAENGVALCTATGDQTMPTIAPDDSGGAIVTWGDQRIGSRGIYAQRISAAGVVQWPDSGVAITTGINRPAAPTIVADGGSGAIVAWSEYDSSDNNIYVQRISAGGTPLWTANGVALCTAPNGQYYPTIVTDGGSGAIISWLDQRSGNNGIYAQRITAGGTPLWTENGVVLCTATSGLMSPGATPDDSGGAIVTWQDQRSGNFDIYAQRISPSGTALWVEDGVALCTATGDQTAPAIASDDGAPGEAGSGAIVTWRDLRSGPYNGDIYAQRISAGGTPQWIANGVALCTDAAQQHSPTIVADGGSGAIVAWDDRRTDFYGDIYAQRISADGAPQWTANGVALCSATGDQWNAIIVTDGGSGAIVAWQDNRNGNYDIYAQRVWADGTTPVLLSFASAEVGADFVSLTWFASGSESAVATVYRAPVGGEWTRIGEVAVDGTGYLRYTDPIDVTASRVGYRLGIVEAGIESFQGETWVDLPARAAALAFALEPVRPNPTQGGALTVRFTLPSAAAASLELLDVSGRRIAEREVGSLGAGRHALDLGEGRNLAPGLYLVRLRQGTNTRVARVAVLLKHGR